MYEKPGQLKEILDKIDFSPETLLVGIREQVRDELHLDIDPFHVYINILSLCIFPVVARPLIQTIFSYSNEQMTRFYEERTTETPVFILNALKGYENNSAK